jgi:protease I
LELLSLKNIAVIIDDMFEDAEYTEPACSFTAAGHKLTHIGLKKGKCVKGKKKGTEVKINEEIKDVKVDDFDALLIPGGYSPDKLRSHEEAVNFVKDFMKSEKPIFAICHAPQLLISADVLKNRTITGWKSIVQDIKNAGANFVDEEVVVEGNLVSSRSPKDLPAFINKSLDKLK